MNLLRKKGYACLAAIAFAFTLMPTMVNAEAKQTSDSRDGICWVY